MLREIVIDWFRKQNSENTEVFLSDLLASLDDRYKTSEIKLAVLELIRDGILEFTVDRRLKLN